MADRKRVLVVDDDGLMLRNTKKLLEGTYDVSIANSGLKVLTSLEKNRADLILLDYEMPECNGAQTLELIRESEEYADIPVVFLTGLGSEQNIRTILSLKPAGYLMKPPEPQTWLAKIRELI